MIVAGRRQDRHSVPVENTQCAVARILLADATEHFVAVSQWMSGKMVAFAAQILFRLIQHRARLLQGFR